LISNIKNNKKLILIKKSDYTLTELEQKIINESNIQIYCTCCSSNVISKIIKRLVCKC